MNGRLDMKFKHLDPTIQESYPKAIAKLVHRYDSKREELALSLLRRGVISLTGNMEEDTKTVMEATP